MVALIGDVGGTNIRLTLRRLNLKTRTSTELKALTKFPSQEVKSIEAAVREFIKVCHILLIYVTLGLQGNKRLANSRSCWHCWGSEQQYGPYDELPTLACC